MLRDGLGFQRTGLLLTRQALGAEAGVQVVQGLLLLLAGTWQEGLAVVAARQSRC